jgi:hypothetical protein
MIGVVVRFDPFQRTTEFEANVLPLTVKVNPEPPAIALDGLSEIMTGTGDTTLKLYADELCPLKFVACTVHVAASLLKVGFNVI